MKSKILLILIGILLQENSLFAQNTQQELGFQTDNDSYAKGSDRYYSNGLFIFYRKALNFENNTNLAKKTIGIEIGQKMFTPQSIKITSTEKIDRPFAGYLYIEPHINLFYKNESNIKFSSLVGVIGKNSATEETQKLIHQVFGFDKPRGWEYQINNQFILNFSTEFNKLLFRKSFYDLTFNSKINLGTGFIGANTGSTIRIGKFNPLYNSVLTQSSVGTSENYGVNNNELYFFLSQKIHFNGYDATIQGNIFKKNNNTQEITSSLENFVFSNQLGIDYKIKHFTASAIFTFQTKDVSTMKKKNHQWGSVIISYLF